MNQALLELKPEDVNMYNVLQQSTCKSTMRRKVAKRTLTALGGASGMCGILNGPEQLRELKVSLKFAQSIEEVWAADKKLKKVTAENKKQKQAAVDKNKKERAASQQQKRQLHYDRALAKIGLLPGDTIFRRYADDLTGPQLKAIAFIHMGKTLTGSVKDIRKTMEELLPVDPHYDHAAAAEGVPPYPTQDELLSDPGSSSEETTASDLIDFDHLYIGDIVEVYWRGENTWYEGQVTDVEAVDRLFEVFYKSDSQKLWHNAEDYPVRTTA